MEKKQEKIRRGPSYIQMFALMVAVVLLTGVVIWQCCKVNELYRQGQADLTQVKDALGELEAYASGEKTPAEGADGLRIELNYPRVLEGDAEDLGETLALVQSANAHALDTINSYLAVFSVLITVVVLIVPLFNYWFLQKDQVKRLDEQYETINKQFDEELNRVRKGIEQSISVSYCISSGSGKSGIGTEIKLVEPISKSFEDIASACAINANILALKGRYIRASNEINKAINLEPKIARYYDIKSTILHTRKLYRDAKESIKIAIMLEPNNASYYDSLGVTLHELENYGEALSNKDRAIELEPNNALYYDSRGATLHAMGSYDKALEDENRAIALEPEKAFFLDRRSATFHAQRRYDRALEDENKVIELEPENASYYSRRGVTLHVLEHYDMALKDENRAIELEPNNATFYSNRAVTLQEMKLYDEALKDDNKAIELEPNNATFYSNRAVTLQKMGCYDEALKNIDEAIRLDPVNANYRKRRKAILQAKEGKQSR